MMSLARADFGIKISFLFCLAVVLVLVIVVPSTIDLWKSHSKRLPGEEPKGTPSLSRASMAFAIIVVIAFALAYDLIEKPFGSSAKISQDIVVALTTTLAAITAFYYGGKTALESAQASESTTASPAIKIISPADGKTYDLNEQVLADYSATGEYDSIVGTTNPGENVDTRTVGKNVFAVSVRDASGHEIAAKTATYEVK